VNHRQVALTRSTATGDQTVGYLKNAGMHFIDSRLAAAAVCAFNKILPPKRLDFYIFDNNLVIPTTK
jgi:hypothetical protein